MANYFIIALTVQLILTVLSGSGGIAAQNVSVSSSANDKSEEDTALAALKTLGGMVARIIDTLSKADDEKVDMKNIAEFVTAMSRAAVFLGNPEIPQLEAFNDEMSSLKQRLASISKALSDQVAALNKKLATSDANLKELEAKLNESEEDLKELIEHSGKSKVGFSAAIATSGYQSALSGQPIKFTRIILNEGGNYNQYTGVFTCPVRGLYFISATITSYTTNAFNIFLYNNGTTVFNLYSHSSSYNYYNMVTQSGLVRCLAGSRIWLQPSGTYNINGNMRSIFTGFLYKKL